MARPNLFDDEDFADPEEVDGEVEGKASIGVFTRRVTDNRNGAVIKLEAHITKSPEDNDGVTWIKFYYQDDEQKMGHCFVDTIDPDIILDAIEGYLANGKFSQLLSFLESEARTAADPISFRVLMEDVLGKPITADTSNYAELF